MLKRLSFEDCRLPTKTHRPPIRNHQSQIKIFIFWLPLAATWLMMSMEGPFIAAVIARLADPKFNLAAYGVAFSFALIVEAPIIMIMSASVALVKDRDSFLKLRNFTYGLNFLITTAMIIILFTPLFNFIAEQLIGLPPKVAHLTRIASIIMLPWPSAIGYRRFYQGILIKFKLTRRVAYGTVTRLGTMALTALFCYFYLDISGAYVGAAALSAGVLVEALASRVMAYSIVKAVCQEEHETAHDDPLTYRKIIKFYYPLALSTMLALGAHPMVTFFLGHSRMALESLAVIPVINSLSFIFRSPGLAMQEVVISMMGDDNEGYIPLRNFALKLGVIVSVGFALIVFTPLAVVWFHKISGLSPELTRFAILPLQIIAVLPALSILLSFQRAMLVSSRHTSPITWATGLEVILMMSVLFIAINVLNLIGAIAAALAYAVGRISANALLVKPCRSALMGK